jgi:hypothetical protein
MSSEGIGIFDYDLYNTGHNNKDTYKAFLSLSILSDLDPVFIY